MAPTLLFNPSKTILLIGLLLVLLPAAGPVNAGEVEQLSTTWIGPVQAGQTAQLAVSWQGEPGAKLSVWIDFNGDGSFEDTEKAIDYHLNAGLQTIDVALPPEARFAETSKMRLRIWTRSKKVIRDVIQPMVGEGPSTCEWVPGFHRPGLLIGSVQSSATFDDGNGSALYVGGQFDSIDGVRVDQIAKWDGHQWGAVGEGLTRGLGAETVQALAVHDNGSGPELFAAAEGYGYDTGHIGFIVRWNGSEWADVADTKGAFYELLSFDDGDGPALYAAGLVDQVAGVDINGIARWDGNSWQDLAPEINPWISPSVRSLEIFDSGNGLELYVGGRIKVGSTTYGLAKWDGATWTYLLPGLETNSTTFVASLKAFDYGTGAALFVGGNYLLDGSRTNLAKWSGTAWSNPITLPVATSFVTELEIHNSGDGPELFGGHRRWDPGSHTMPLGKWNQGQWEFIPGEFDQGVWALTSAAINDLTPVLFAGGSFRKVTDLFSPGLVQWDGSQWHPTPSGSAQGRGRLWPISSLKTFDDGTGSKLYAGGIDLKDGLPKVLAWDGKGWSELGLDPLGPVRALEVFDDGSGSTLYAAGSAYVRRWSGSAWDSLGLAPNSFVSMLAAHPLGGKGGLFAGGPFTEIGGIAAESVAQWDGSEWNPLGTGIDGWVSSMSIHDDGSGPALFVSGNFDTAGGVAVNNVAKWDGTRWSALGTGLEQSVGRLVSHDDGNGPALFANVSVTGLTTAIAKWDGTKWSTLWTGPFFSSTSPLETYNNDRESALYTIGNFPLDGGGDELNLAKWDGSSWIAIDSGGSSLSTLEVFNDGNGAALFAGGGFTVMGGHVSTGFAKWACPQGGDLAVSLEEADTTLVAGTLTAFQIIVENQGHETAPLANLRDEFPPGLACSWTTTVEGDVTGHQNGSGPTLNQVLSIPPGGRITYAVGCQVDSGATGDITNTVTVTAANDPNPTNNTASDTDPIIQETDLQVRVGNGLDDQLFPGGTVTYALTVTNLGPSDTPSTFELDSVFPAELSSCRWFDHRAGGADGQAGGAIQQTLTLAAHDSARYVVTCRVPIDASGTVSFMASLDPGNNPDPNLDNNQDTDADSVQSLGSRETLILTHFGRLQAQTDSSAEDMEALLQTTYQFAAHDKVRGLVLDLGIFEGLAGLYGTWDQAVANGSSHPLLANHILFGCTDLCSSSVDGIHQRVRDALAEHGELKYLMLLGDDRIVPMARILDFSDRFPQEIDYTDVGNHDPGIRSDHTSVGQALARNYFLSDDPLAVARELDGDTLNQPKSVVLTDLLVGRVVEDPGEIQSSLQNFLDLDGYLDLTQLDPDHRVLINAYDFLVDSGLRIRRRWKDVFDLEHDPGDLVPVDGQLISSTWGESSIADRRIALLDHLQGRYGIMSLNGHATHFEAGVPGLHPFDIVGLETEVLAAELDFTGSVIYAVGCHSGLPVADEQAASTDHPLDLPQTMLGLGVLGYVANSGYGWGLKVGVGYSERLVSNMTQVLSNAPSAVLGEAVREAKRRYFQDDPILESLDPKILMQWTLYGFPMTAIKIREGSSLETPAQPPFIIESQTTESGDVTPPPFLLRSTFTRDFSAPGDYVKYQAVGAIVPEGVEGCPPAAAGEPEGCYYTYKGDAVAEGDLPLEPMLVSEELVSNTSLHDVLWTGGEYLEEDDWRPVLAEPVSNGEGSEDPQALPRTTFIRPRGSFRGGPLVSRDPCRDVDSEPTQFVLVSGGLRFDNQGEPTLHQLFQTMSLETFHFNNTENPEANCDRKGPNFGEGPYHSVENGTVTWSVPILDDELWGDDIWRVVAVWDDRANSRWTPVELTREQYGDPWIGSVTPGVNQQLTYFLQAVDKKGNVSWVEFQEPPKLLERKAEEDYRFLDLPRPFDVSLETLLFADGFESGDCSRWSGDC